MPNIHADLSVPRQELRRRRGGVGLYRNPPDQALVLCVDEKSQSQAHAIHRPPRRRQRLSTVNRAHIAFDYGELKALLSKPSGGRMRANMPLAEEKALLARFRAVSRFGGARHSYGTWRCLDASAGQRDSSALRSRLAGWINQYSLGIGASA